MNQSDIFVKEEEQVKAKDQIDAIKSIPSEYMKIELSSMGRLSTPDVLHFRNYTTDDMIKLDTVRPEDYEITLVNLLSNMNYEKFDCLDLTRNEFLEILFYIYANWTSPVLRNVKSFDSENKSEIVDVELKRVQSSLINEKFKEPFLIKHNNKAYSFRLPRMRDEVMAKRIIENQYRYQKKSLENYVAEAKANKVNRESKEFIDKTIEGENLAIEIVRRVGLVTMAYCLVGDDSREFSDEEKIDIAGNIDPMFWTKFKSIKDTYSKFGIDENVKVRVPDARKLETRRCQFRAKEFVPDMELPSNTEVDVTFGVSLQPK